MDVGFAGVMAVVSLLFSAVSTNSYLSSPKENRFFAGFAVMSFGLAIMLTIREFA